MAQKKKTKKEQQDRKKLEAENRKKKKEAAAKIAAQEEKQQDDANKKIEQDYSAGEVEANKSYAEGSLGRLNLTTPILSRATANPNISKVTTSMIGGNQSIAQAEDAYNKSQIRDQYVQQALDRAMQATMGISAPENQALRETSTREMKNQGSTALRALRKLQGQAGITGNAAMAGASRLMNDTNKGLREAETDLLAKNIDFKNTAINNLGSMANTADYNFNTFKTSALNNLLGIRKDVSDFQMSGEKANQEADQKTFDNTMGVSKFNNDAALTDYDIAKDQQLINMQQAEKEKAGFLGVKYGQAGVSNSYRESEEEEDLYEELMRIANKGV